MSRVKFVRVVVLLLFSSLLLGACSDNPKVPAALNGKKLQTINPDNRLPYETVLNFRDDQLVIITTNPRDNMEIGATPDDDWSGVKQKKYPYLKESKVFQDFLEVVVGKDISKITADDWSNSNPRRTTLRIKEIIKNGEDYQVKTNKMTFTLFKYDNNSFKLANGTVFVFTDKNEK